MTISSVSTTETTSRIVPLGQTSTTPTLQMLTTRVLKKETSRSSSTKFSKYTQVSTTTRLSLQHMFGKTRRKRAPVTNSQDACWSRKVRQVDGLVIENEKGIKEGAWDSIHIFDMQEDKDTKGNPLTKCKLVSTVIMSVTAEHKDTYGAMEFAGTVNKRVRDV